MSKTIYDYAIQKRCPSCGAKRDRPCNAPTKNKRADRRGLDERDHERLHGSRQAIGRIQWIRSKNA